MVYTSLENSKIKELSKLKDKKMRDNSNLFLVEGEHLVNEAFKHGYLKTLIKLIGYNYDLKVETLEVNEKILKNLSSLKNTPFLMGVCEKKCDQIKGDHLLILDEIQDPGNLGTIIRSAVAFNIDTIILSKNTVDLYNEKVLRATQGLIFSINIVRADLPAEIIALKKQNFKIYATKVNGGKTLKNIEKSAKFAIIMGNEGNGVSNSLLELCDDYLYIPMNSKCESLNVGVATSIILYELDK
jgi:RNA methyltransferase, TrmH family